MTLHTCAQIFEQTTNVFFSLQSTLVLCSDTQKLPNVTKYIVFSVSSVVPRFI